MGGEGWGVYLTADIPFVPKCSIDYHGAWGVDLIFVVLVNRHGTHKNFVTKLIKSEWTVAGGRELPHIGSVQTKARLLSVGSIMKDGCTGSGVELAGPWSPLVPSDSGSASSWCFQRARRVGVMDAFYIPCLTSSSNHTCTCEADTVRQMMTIN